MKETLFSLFLVIINSCLFGQTDKEILSQYDSLSEWKVDESKLENYIDKYYQETDSVMEFFLEHITYPYYAKLLGSEAIVLIECQIYEDTTIIKFKNKTRFGFKRAIRDFFKIKDTSWTNIPKSGIKFNLAIGYFYGDHSKVRRQKCNVSVITYETHDYECSFFKGDKRFLTSTISKDSLRTSKTAIMDKSFSRAIIHELLQRYPFDKKLHEKYYEKYAE